MSKNLLLILTAGVDIWAALYITQLERTDRPWEVSIAINDPNQTATPSDREPIQIWIDRQGELGLWPDRSTRKSIAELTTTLTERARAAERGLDVRLLCARELTIAEWGPAAVELAKSCDRLQIAPLEP